MVRLFKAKKDDVKVTLVESNQILSSFDQRLRNYAEKKIKSRHGFTLKQDFVTGKLYRTYHCKIINYSLFLIYGDVISGGSHFRSCFSSVTITLYRMNRNQPTDSTNLLRFHTGKYS